ncbi:MAG: hypothetical protein JKY37_23490 [Nannocystaceae bacterium]|nr:hypothetical protein [Nannocystaceae bacterium]
MKTLVCALSPVLLLLLACGPKPAATVEPGAQPATPSVPEDGVPEDGVPEDGGPGLPGSEVADRPELSAEQCTADGGAVVGDIGDGAVHSPDYTCDDGQAPVASVPSGIEGAVCCPGA